jgi:hypothetical protein
MMRSAAPSSRINQDGKVPASGNGHNTGEPPIFRTFGAIPEGADLPSLSGAARTKLEA